MMPRSLRTGDLLRLLRNGRPIHSPATGRCLVVQRSATSSSSSVSVSEILEQVKNGTMEPSAAEALLTTTPEDALAQFANLDHTRSRRTGFPEAVFAEGKTAFQVAKILDDMAKNVNEHVDAGDLMDSQKAILATRVTMQQYEELKQYPLENGSIEYHETARIISMQASSLSDGNEADQSSAKSANAMKRIIVATAGTTDLPVAEEAAVTLEATGCDVERITDVGVAGLHRIVCNIPKLSDPEVGCIIVCAGMDGALPSVVGGLANVPVIAVPTSIGYGVSLGGISAMLTMLNSCAPGVGVVNIDNGFGAAALAHKIVRVGK